MPGKIILLLAQVQTFQEFVDPGAFRGPPEELPEEDVFPDGIAFEKVKVLKDKAHGACPPAISPGFTELVEWFAGKVDVSLGRGQEAAEDVQQSGFARSAGSGKGDLLAFVKRPVGKVENGLGPAPGDRVQVLEIGNLEKHTAWGKGNGKGSLLDCFRDV